MEWVTLEWVKYAAFLALYVAFWHEINRFPATNKSITKIKERLDEIEVDNRDLQFTIERLNKELLLLSNEIDKLKKPDY